MSEKTTVLLDKKTIELLKKTKDYPRQTYNELLKEMATIFMKMKQRDQYDEFLHKIQQPKMKEIWNNKEDEDWENA